MAAALKRPSPEALLAKLKVGDKPTLRVYIGVAPSALESRRDEEQLDYGNCDQAAARWQSTED
jgi:hypothetical protein